MRQGSGWSGGRVSILFALAACSMFGQAPAMRHDLESLRHDAETAAGRGECASAISLYQSAISVEQDTVWAHRGLADCYRLNGAWGKAADQYETVTRIDPDDADARRLASLTRQALAEQQEDVVRAATYTAIKQFPLSWLPRPRATSGISADGGGGPQRGLHFESNKTPAQVQGVESIPVQVAFSRNHYTLNEKAVRQLTEVAAAISTGSVLPESVVVEGHTCACGSVEANKVLGGRRAEAVRDFLVSKGVAPATHFTTISYGSSRPVESAGALNLPPTVCERDAIHSENRRVVILLIGAVANATPLAPPLSVSFLSRRSGSGSFELIQDGGRLHTGDEYMIRLHSPNPLYAYVFHRQSDGSWMALAPVEVSQGGSAQFAISVGPDRDVSIPSPTKGYELDKSTGVEETIVYSRTEPDKDLDTLVGKIQTAPPDKGFYGLRPPELPDPPRSEQRVPVRPVQQPPVREGEKHGEFGKNQSEQQNMTAPATSAVSGSAPATAEGHHEADMRGIVWNTPVSNDWPLLPNDPVAYVRFNHLAK